MFAVTVMFEIKASHVNDFLPLMTANAKASLKEEPGCRQFDVCCNPAKLHEVFLYELYDDEAAFRAHLLTRHFKVFDAKVASMVANKTVQTFTQVIQ
ncbi:putative quinol monooxygenase [Labrenzia sp. PHM005]|uniref:putative quinol monooxygenase n=1 Tax=Labrenzia sp. PHM005 TaxID=2590016 RepID=UPI0011406F0E|nr:putative quinol monooxygenase [Labrenzia sp. PHM005]QDG76119.1 antibiotic biosynthesis monooxygenase [Labrenzia sp. PHM005]